MIFVGQVLQVAVYAMDAIALLVLPAVAVFLWGGRIWAAKGGELVRRSAAGCPEPARRATCDEYCMAW